MWETWVWFSGEGNGNPLQHFCLENPMDGGAWWATVHGVAKSWTRLRDFTFTFTMWQVGRSLLLQPGEPWPTLLHPKLAPDSLPSLGQAVGVSGSPGQRATAWSLISPLFSWVAKVPEIINSIQQARQEELHCQTEFNDTFARSSRCCFAATWWWRSGRLRQPWSTSAWRASVTWVVASLGSVPVCVAATGGCWAGPQPVCKSFSKPWLPLLGLRKGVSGCRLAE